jgi:hypothetical protein
MKAAVVMSITAALASMGSPLEVSAQQPYTCTTKKCVVQIAVTNCPGASCKIVPAFDPLTIKGNQDVDILWRLPAGYAFCAALGDGIFLKKNDDGQFYDNYSTEDGDGGRPKILAAGKPNYHWKDQNTTKKPYDYKIIFHDTQCKTRFEKDPVIINDM